MGQRRCIIASVFKLTAVLLFGAAALAPRLSAQPQVYGGGAIKEIYRIRLDRGDLLLESILDIIKKHDIGMAPVLTAAGTLQDCTFTPLRRRFRQAGLLRPSRARRWKSST